MEVLAGTAMPETSSYGKRFGNTTAAPRSSRPPGTSSSGNRGVIAASWPGQNGQVAALVSTIAASSTCGEALSEKWQMRADSPVTG